MVDFTARLLNSHSSTPFVRCCLVFDITHARRQHGTYWLKVLPITQSLTKHDVAFLVQRHVSGTTDGTTAETRAKPESYTTTALIAEVKHLRAEVERL